MRPKINKKTIWKSKALMELLNVVNKGSNYARTIARARSKKDSSSIAKQLKLLESFGLVESNKIKFCNVKLYKITIKGKSILLKHKKYVSLLKKIKKMEENQND